MKVAWRQKATVPFKACYAGFCLLGGSGAVLLALPDEATTRNATWLDPVKAAEIRAANRGLPGDVRAAASAADEPGRPQ
jgi:hypothetical protein